MVGSLLISRSTSKKRGSSQSTRIWRVQKFGGRGGCIRRTGWLLCSFPLSLLTSPVVCGILSEERRKRATIEKHDDSMDKGNPQSKGANPVLYTSHGCPWKPHFARLSVKLPYSCSPRTSHTAFPAPACASDQHRATGEAPMAQVAHAVPGPRRKQRFLGPMERKATEFGHDPLVKTMVML